MSEQVVVNPTQTQAQPATYILYDPARRRRARRRKYDPMLIAYEPARRRRRVRRLDPVRVGGKALTDSLVDGLGFSLLMHAVPAIPEGNVSGLSYRDVGAAIVTAAYEKVYMRRGWSATLLGAIAALATGKIVSSLGGWKP